MVVQDGIHDEQVKHMKVPIIGFGINQAVTERLWEIRHDIIPLLIINQVVIKDRGVPVTVRVTWGTSTSHSKVV